MCASTFTTERLWQFRRLRELQAWSNGSVVVHQMSKVGSQTVVASIHKTLPRFAIYHTHFLSQQGLAWLEGFVRERWGSIHVPMHLWHGLFIRERLQSGTGSERLKIVTLVRDPVARNISEFFQELEEHTQYPYERKIAELGVDGVATELEGMLLQKLTQDVDWNRPYAWFDPEIRDVLGIDLFAEAFDTAAGYGLFSKGQTDLLLIKLEQLPASCDQAFNEFLGVADFTLATKNVAARKYYADAYQKILGRLAIPVATLEKWYSADQVTHFYNQSEIKAFIDKWSRASDR